MKYTLLSLVQDILSSMDSDEVNSISDSPESLQVVKVIKTVYDDIQSRSDLNINKTLFNLVSSNDITKPVLMRKPENIDNISWIKYNAVEKGKIDPEWKDIEFLPVDSFMDLVHQYIPSNSDVELFEFTVGGSAFEFTYKNNVAPKYYTSFDDVTIIFDSYDKEVDSVLQSSKTLCFGNKVTDFAEVDDFEFNLQPQQYALLLNEAKALAWSELKQSIHQRAELASKRNWRHIQKVRSNIPSAHFENKEHPFNKLPYFGRR